MAMAVGAGEDLKSEINITPFIDVLLVLLVIFMITQPLLRKVLDIQVPVEAQANTVDQSQNIVLEIMADGSLAINTQPVTREGLSAKLHEIYDVRADKLLFIRADNNRRFSEVIQAIDVARGAGVKVFGLAPPEAAAPAAS